MKQLQLSLATGSLSLADVPVPIVSDSCVLIRSVKSLVSSGTERMLAEFGKAGLYAKISSQPDKVQQVISKAINDGPFVAFNAVKSKLEYPQTLGYCNVGIVVAVGKNVTTFKIGDRIASNGPHADFVSVPQNLCALIPDSVSDEAASFTVLSSIGLQGIRLAQPTFGETFSRMIRSENFFSL